MYCNVGRYYKVTQILRFCVQHVHKKYGFFNLVCDEMWRVSFIKNKCIFKRNPKILGSIWTDSSFASRNLYLVTPVPSLILISLLYIIWPLKLSARHDCQFKCGRQRESSGSSRKHCNAVSSQTKQSVASLTVVEICLLNFSDRPNLQNSLLW